jgi:hypothetical protein
MLYCTTELSELRENGRILQGIFSRRLKTQRLFKKGFIERLRVYLKSQACKLLEVIVLIYNKYDYLKVTPYTKVIKKLYLRS